MTSTMELGVGGPVDGRVPAVFNVTQADVLAAYPVLAEASVAVDSLFRCADVEVDDSNLAVFNGVDLDSRAIRRKSASYQDTINDLFMAGGNHISQLMPDRRDAAITAQLQGKFQGEAGGAIEAELRAGVLQSGTEISKLKELATQLGPKMAKTMDEGDAIAQFNLLKMFISHPDAGEELMVDGLELAYSPSSVLGLLDSLQGSNIQRTLLARLEKGQFDTPVAKDAIRHAMHNPSASPEASKLSQLARFFTAVFRAEGVAPLSAMVEDRIAAVLADWPGDAHSAFASYRSGLEAQLRMVCARREAERDSIFAPNETDTAFLFSRSLTALLMRIVHSSPPGTYGKAAIMKDRAALKRKRVPVKPTETDSTEPASNPEMIPEPWQLVRLKFTNIGNAVREIVDDDPVAVLRDEFLSNHNYRPGTPISDAVTLILENMQKLDFSQSRISGVRVMGGALIKPDGDSHASWPVYEYKPMHAFGNANSAERARKIRVLFSILKGRGHQLGILAVLERDELTLFARNNNLAPASSRGNK